MYVLASGLRVVDLEDSTFDEEVMANTDGRALPGVVGVFFESSAENGEFLSLQVGVELVEHSLEEDLFPLFVHLNHSIPIVCHLLEPLAFG